MLFRSSLANFNAEIMKKKIIASITLLCLLAIRPGVCDEFSYDDEEDDLFNRGKMVTKESDEYERARRRERQKNWTLALTSTAVGIATFILVSKDHNKR